jgi:hypothetical protein
MNPIKSAWSSASGPVIDGLIDCIQTASSAVIFVGVIMISIALFGGFSGSGQRAPVEDRPSAGVVVISNAVVTILISNGQPNNTP